MNHKQTISVESKQKPAERQNVIMKNRHYSHIQTEKSLGQKFTNLSRKRKQKDNLEDYKQIDQFKYRNNKRRHLTTNKPRYKRKIKLAKEQTNTIPVRKFEFYPAPYSSQQKHYTFILNSKRPIPVKQINLDQQSKKERNTHPANSQLYPHFPQKNIHNKARLFSQNMTKPDIEFGFLPSPFCF